ncbi:hypothetical protein DL96DRAFT_1638852 [Flagelloscypha sp. PMI_526]|nr:hypothetical protein DL96DRAFT_1638852 [Flagelloscypha sp. PMI_526]
MDSSTPITIPVELWQEILVHSSDSDLVQTSLANSQLLEVSKDILYSKLFVWGDVHLIPVLPALRNPDYARRLRYVLLDPGYKYEESSHLEEMLGILRRSPLVRLDIVTFHGLKNPLSNWMRELLMQFVQLPQLQQLKLFLTFFRPPEVVPVLQAHSMWDLDIPDVIWVQNMHLQGESTNTSSGPLPFLNTLRIQNLTRSWSNILEYVDISRMKRLAIWGHEQRMEDLTQSWGKLVTASARTLESLSLWLSPNLLDQDIPTYLYSVAGFPRLRTITLFFTRDSPSHTPLWLKTFPPILAAFHSRSPSLRHIRVYVHSWNVQYPYEFLLQNQLFTEFAREMKRLKNLETIKFSFRHSSLTDPNDNEMGIAQLGELFSPVHLSIEYGVFWNHAWPFFEDDRSGAGWARIMKSSDG